MTLPPIQGSVPARSVRRGFRKLRWPDLAVWLILAARSAGAQPTDSPALPPPGAVVAAAPAEPPRPIAGPTPVSAAAAAFQAGHRAFESGDYEAARHSYEEAYRLAPHPNTLYNLGLTCERLLDYDAAIAAFERFLASPPAADLATDGQRTRRVLAERSLRRLRNLPARVSAGAVPESVSVSIAPLLDGGTVGAITAQGQTPHIFTVSAGRYRLTYFRDGYFPEEQDIDAHVGQALLVTRQLRPRPRLLRIESQPVASLYLDDRLVGRTPYEGTVALGSHRLRLERRFYLTQIRPLELAPGGTRLRYRIALVQSGRADMILGGALAGAGLGLMVLRLFQGEIENIENMPPGEIYKPLVAALLPAALGATLAGLAGWEMPVGEGQLLIGSAAWGSLIGFGVGLGVQPEWLLPHVLSIGGGLIGGIIGTAVWRFRHPSSGAVAVFNSAVLWSAQVGALSWAYLVTERPETSFFGRQALGRSGEGGWAMLGSTLIGVGLGIGLANLPGLVDLPRGRVALIDLGGLAGGLALGILGLGLGYGVTGSWPQAGRIAVPCSLGGIAIGLVSGALLTRRYHAAPGPAGSGASPSLASRNLDLELGSFRTRLPSLTIGGDGLGGTAMGVTLFDGEF